MDGAVLGSGRVGFVGGVQVHWSGASCVKEGAKVTAGRGMWHLACGAQTDESVRRR